jgi:hypothetical protein
MNIGATMGGRLDGTTSCEQVLSDLQQVVHLLQLRRHWQLQQLD